ncbi:hypothetical protein ISR92_01405 [Patescibacteria group bacterium]|nr:hypothetical protein [Patescibacteria group bacterium]
MNKLEINRASVYSSIELLPAQIEQAWTVMEKARIPVNYKKINNIVICGMGGSNIGFHMVQKALSERLNVPIIIHADYNLPKFVDKNTLVILSSYSGNTEEVLSAAKKVQENKLKGYIITGGGKLSKMVGKIPGIVLPMDFNPSNEPRWGLGHSIGAFIQLLHKVEVVKISEDEIMKANSSVKDEEMQSLAKEIKDKQIVVMAAEHLEGNAHIFCNQLNETADNMAVYFTLPELNHHLMEAFSFPKGFIKAKTMVVFLASGKYSSKIQKRLKVTKKVLNKQGIKWAELSSGMKKTLQDSLSTLQLASYLCYYMSVVNKVDPIAIPTVDFFKKEMKK